LETEKRKKGPRISSGLLYSKRRYPRFKVDGLSCHLASGNMVFDGMVEDISEGGFKMANLPSDITANRYPHQAVLSGNGRHHRLIVVPCWVEKSENSRSTKIGFRIIQASWEWTEHIMSTASSRTYAHQA
jgi:hypothetical protein